MITSFVDYIMLLDLIVSDLFFYCILIESEVANRKTKVEFFYLFGIMWSNKNF